MVINLVFDSSATVSFFFVFSMIDADILISAVFAQIFNPLKHL